MKIAFSTLACPGAGFDEILAMAKDLGFHGIEVRGILGELSAYRAAPFRDGALPETVRKLRALRLEIPCLSSNGCLKDGAREAETFAEIGEYVKLAERLGTPYVRVLADRGVYPEGEADDAAIAERLRALSRVAEAAGVTLLVETNGVYADTKRLRALLIAVASDSVAALWDTHHPYRVMGESPDETVGNLGAYVKYVHIKDSVLEGGELRYRLMGEGDLPLPEMLGALRSIDYEGCVSLEWVKRWSAELEDAGIAVPQFAHYMARRLGGPAAPSGERHPNRAGTGFAPWRKGEVLEITLPALLDRVAAEFPDQPALLFPDGGGALSYREFRDRADRFARALIALNVRRGDKVAVWATNLLEWYLTFWAATRIGAVLVTMNTYYKIHEAEYLLRQSDAHTLVMIRGFKDSDYAGALNAICPELAALPEGEPLRSARLPFLRNVISAGFEMPGAIPFEAAEAMAERVPEGAVRARIEAMGCHDVCNMQYTSGTTGFPKGVMLTHHNVINNGKAIGDRMDLSTADRFLIHVPMFHCFGMVLSMLSSVTHAASMAPIPSFSPSAALRAIPGLGITAVNGVPTMFIAMLEHPDFPKTDCSTLRTGIMAGSPCPAKVMREVIDRMNMAEVTIVFGQTESSPGCTMSDCGDPLEVKVNTVGRPLPGIECRIADPETGEALPDGADGEFLARGYNVMKGYYKMPAATAAAIDADGWLHTGDLARRDPDGNFKITGRIRDMIIRGGENVYPKEIEDFLYTHENVRDVQVVGVPDAQYGEEILACVILKRPGETDESEIREYVRAHMARQKAPKYVRFVTEFPMNAAGKILKYVMSEKYAEELGLSGAAREPA